MSRSFDNGKALREIRKDVGRLRNRTQTAGSFPLSGVVWLPPSRRGTTASSLRPSESGRKKTTGLTEVDTAA